MSTRFHSRTWILAAGLLLAAGAATAVWAASESPGSGSVQGFTAIATGPDQNVDGFLSIPADDYGQWASVGFSGGGDIYNPVGAAGPLEATFSSALFLFVPSRQQRTVLTENPDYLAIGSDGSLLLSLDAPSVASDTNMDGVDDTLVSSFSAAGSASTALSFDLTQTVETCDGAVLTQTYVMTNTDSASVDYVLARNYDADLVWNGDFSNDQVGTDFNMNGGDRYVFQEEAADPATSITVSSDSASSYYGGKQGIQPSGGPPPYDFGTDTEVFEAFGVPTSWQNHVANVGYDTDGVSGTMPGMDGFIGLGWSGTLGSGESTTITILTTFGQNFPGTCAPPPPPFDIDIPTLGQFGMIALVVLLAAFGLTTLRRRGNNTAS